MSEHNYMNLFFKENLKNRPQDFIINEDELNKTIAKTVAASQALHAKNDASKPKPDLRKEYNQLRKQLFDLQQYAKGAETYANNKAGEVKHRESLINDLLKQKKEAIASGNLGQERFLEHQIVLIETELIDAKIEFNRAKHQSSNAARGLKAFDGHERIAELAKILAV